MIGQQRNMETIKKWRLKRSTPRFILISGEGERLELAKVIGKSLNASTVIVGKTADEIRDVVRSSYEVTKTTLYILEDGDNMSAAASNSLLKITEEPPYNSYFVMLCEDKVNILGTIISRSTSMPMNRYSVQELMEVTKEPSLLSYCTNPVQIREYLENVEGFKEFVSYCDNIANNIVTMSGLDSFRINEKLKLKDDSKGTYDAVMFVRIVSAKLVNKVSYKKMSIIVRLGSAACVDLKHKSLKKGCSIDRWLLDLRKELKH